VLIYRFSRALGLICVFALGGCAVVTTKASRDTDGDRVVDALDECAQTRAGHPVDDQGCELFDGVLQGVNFAPGAAALNAAARKSLDRLILLLRQHQAVVLSIDGHTDNRGSAGDNLALSKKRVMSVVKYLVVKGIDGRRLRPYGYGESRPKVSNATSGGRQQNRRIEISVYVKSVR